ncbi:hypothetical protein BC939DRAFT_532434 [Gamsiella multidivaricata]|uniref:uncharacterized protein n=1 Tax=Gamsiella multidivaricata TaxID=101098 RepID=UPI00221E3D0B|nr:uncharacterized protein BC939DRAFT_532434 [Gamsiella multidivaricata]KAG0369313.1 hypothetical protein BGZ54_010271 [Gamsiella multidivaricata]KAI7817865.1 hypothetical protein BC939DRAFT_532434 [Gamsiella multidivaricata]
MEKNGTAASLEPERFSHAAPTSDKAGGTIPGSTALSETTAPSSSLPASVLPTERASTTEGPKSVATAEAPSKRPDWATGDPFFDTMAGMGSPEYQRYYTGITYNTEKGDNQDQGLETEAAAMTLADQDSGSANKTCSSTEASSPDSNTGLDHWNRTRDQWTKGRWHVVPSANSNNPALSAINPKNHDAIYDSLVYDRKRLSKPIPLPLVIKVLVSGWKRDGLWQESPAQPPSGPGSTPSSAPSQGINSYVPGFSSTHSLPIQKKL